MKRIRVEAVVITDGEHTFIHGMSGCTSTEMFKAMTSGESPIWKFDPRTEYAHVTEVTLEMPEYEKTTKEIIIDALDAELDAHTDPY